MSTRVEDGLSWSSGSSVRSEKNPEAPKLVDILVAFAVSSAASPEIVKSWPQDALPRLVKIEASVPCRKSLGFRGRFSIQARTKFRLAVTERGTENLAEPGMAEPMVDL